MCHNLQYGNIHIKFKIWYNLFDCMYQNPENYLFDQFLFNQLGPSTWSLVVPRILNVENV